MKSDQSSPVDPNWVPSEAEAQFHAGIRRLIQTSENRAQALQRIIAQAMLITGGDGFAIALPHGDAIVCECSTGAAPGIGVTVQREGYSGECLSSGRPVYCRDLPQERAARAPGGMAIRSALLVPILHGGEAAGLMAVFSALPEAFRVKHQIWMSAAAEEISAAGFAGPVVPGRDAGAGPRLRHRHFAAMSLEASAALGFRIQDWVLAQQQQSRQWANISLLAAVAAFVELLSPLYITMPYLLWILTGAAALVAIVSGHKARRAARRAQNKAPRRCLLGLVLGYGTAVCFALALIFLHWGD